jgi:hypothetical protein
LGHPEASGYCSQSERLLFGRDTRNLRRCFRRFVGRNRKSRRREAAGRRNYPEAVPNGEGRNGSNAPKQVLSVLSRARPTENRTVGSTPLRHLTAAAGEEFPSLLWVLIVLRRNKLPRELFTIGLSKQSVFRHTRPDRRSAPEHKKFIDSQIFTSTDEQQSYVHTFTSVYNIVTGIQTFSWDLAGCGKIVRSQQFLGWFKSLGSFRASEA